VVCGGRQAAVDAGRTVVVCLLTQRRIDIWTGMRVFDGTSFA
jgi:hypothetical protein